MFKIFSYKLINEPSFDDTRYQIFFNRKVTNLDDIKTLLNIENHSEVLNDPTLLGEDLLDEAYNIILSAIRNNQKMAIIVDSDCDGFTSAALF